MSAPKFRTGDGVRMAERFLRNHHRVPTYIKGHSGVVEWMCGIFGKPEQPLYRVRFTMDHLWRDRAENGTDTVEVEIYEHWLEAKE